MASEFRRLHPISLIFRIGRSITSLMLPGLLFLFLSRGSRSELVLMVAFVPALAFDLLSHFVMQYQLGDEELVVREGILTRTVRHIPFARIQNIDVVQNPVHRLFRVAEVRVETASGAEPEAVLKVLSVDLVERMRTMVLLHRSFKWDWVS
jgi:putative membrane protein